MNLSFRMWMLEDENGLHEMASFHFGQHRDKQHTEIPSGYLDWMRKQIRAGKSRGFDVRERGRALGNADLLRLIDQELDRRGYASEEEPPARPAPPPPRPAAPPPPPPARALPSASQAPAEKWWTLAKVIGTNAYGLQADQDVALSKNKEGNWEFVTLDAERHSGVIPAASVKSVVRSIKGENDQPIQSQDLADLFQRVAPEDAPEEETPGEEPAAGEASPKKNPHILSDEMLDSGTAPGEKSEQRQIDEKFKEIMEGGRQNHIMINALAGAGKTTMLKHLAWKYGKPGQKWLYLVFNTKNKVEAKEKFPPWVEVATTNGFLGNMLKSQENKSRIRQTDRTADISKNHPGEKGQMEKARILVSFSPQFNQLVQSLGLPSKDAAKMVPASDSIKKTLGSLLNSMQYHFKEQVLTLTGLAKSFSLDPRNQAEVLPKLKWVMEKYDFDTALSEVKDRIEKYATHSPSYHATITGHLRRILGYDFMQKDYKDEIMQATAWMMNETMPHASQYTYKKDDFEYPMGRFRDFNDDLWFAAVHADELHWPHFDVVLADEVQDFNDNQKIAIKKLHEAGAKIVAVGDPDQAIYRFRGADGDAFNNLATQLGDLSADKEGWKPFTLSKNYRSRKAILDFANENTHVNKLKQGKVFKDGHDGTVTSGDVEYDDVFGQLKEEWRNARADKLRGRDTKVKPTAFIARTNEPLVNAALKLLANAVPFIIVGKDVAKDLLSHIDRVVRITGLGDFAPVADLQEKLNEHLEKEMDQHGGVPAKRAQMQELQETTQALLNCISMFAPEMAEDYPGDEPAYGRGRKPAGKNISQFKAWLKANLSGLDVAEKEKDLMEYRRKVEQENPVILTTAHKSKGLEFERVYILRNDQFPHPKAKRPEDLAQEDNAKYVAYTRAMDELHILKLEGQPGYKSPSAGGRRVEF